MGRDDRSRSVVRGGWVLSMDPGEPAPRRRRRDRADGSIAAVGPADEPVAARPGAEVIGDGHGIVMPGLSTRTPTSARA